MVEAPRCSAFSDIEARLEKVLERALLGTFKVALHEILLVRECRRWSRIGDLGVDEDARVGIDVRITFVKQIRVWKPHIPLIYLWECG